MRGGAANVGGIVEQLRRKSSSDRISSTTFYTTLYATLYATLYEEILCFFENTSHIYGNTL